MSYSKKRQKRLNQAIKQIARKAVKITNFQDYNCPLFFANLTFQIFSSYLVLKHQARNDGENEGVRWSKTECSTC
jgi:hypothetical protein